MNTTARIGVFIGVTLSLSLSAPAKAWAAKKDPSCSLSLTVNASKISAGIKHALRYSRGYFDAIVVFDADAFAAQKRYKPPIVTIVQKLTASKLRPSDPEFLEPNEPVDGFYRLKVSTRTADLRQIAQWPSVSWIAKTAPASTLRRLAREKEAARVAAERAAEKAEQAEIDRASRIEAVNEEIEELQDRLRDVLDSLEMTSAQSNDVSYRSRLQDEEEALRHEIEVLEDELIALEDAAVY